MVIQILTLNEKSAYRIVMRKKLPCDVENGIIDNYIIAEFRVTKTGVFFKPVGNTGIKPSAHIFQRLWQIPMVQSHLVVFTFENHFNPKIVEKVKQMPSTFFFVLFFK